MTDKMNEFAEYRKRKKFQCPHCGNNLTLDVSVAIGDISKVDDNGDSLDWRDSLLPSEKELLEVAEGNGTIAAFTQAIQKLPEIERPKNCEKYFLNFLKYATPKRVPQFALDYLNNEFGRQPIVIMGYQRMLGAVISGQLRFFIPAVLVTGTPIKSMGGTSRNMKGVIPADEQVFVNWIRTKYGYIVGKGEYFDSMKKRALGDFAKPGL